MNILVINLDKAIFKKNSASFERLKEYSAIVEKLFVIVWTREKFSPIIFDDRLVIYPTNSSCRLFYYFDTWRLARNILRKNKIDLIFTQDPFETGLAGVLLAVFNRIKLQLQFHTDVFSLYFWRQSRTNKIRVMLAKVLIKRADSLRVVSARIKTSLIKLGVASEKIFVLPIYTDVGKITGASVKLDLKSKYPQFEKIILMASRLSPEKNIGLAIEAMLKVVKKQPRIGLIIFGSGREEVRLKSLIKKNGLASRVILETWTDDLASYYKTADLFLLTSNYEGWGMAAVEAMAAGCPVIMTDVGCAGELVKDGENGFIVPVGDGDVLSQTIIRVLGDHKLGESLTRRAAETIKKLADKEEYLRQYKKSWL
ncbi:MAG: glycosyltransferase family 4 protein [Patescibacteria group bacterium]|jgi:glycosyltransferase involved in cell wall biosynthesis